MTLPGASEEPPPPADVEVVAEFGAGLVGVVLVDGDVAVGGVGLAVLEGGGAIVGLLGVAGVVLWAREGDAAHSTSAATDMRNLSILRVLRGIPPLSVNSGMYLKFLALARMAWAIAGGAAL
jgi:hypothetical protein